ncbi:hypothetical protein NUSPORA_02507 [Nucleospora cyclopteri]
MKEEFSHLNKTNYNKIITAHIEKNNVKNGCEIEKMNKSSTLNLEELKKGNTNSKLNTNNKLNENNLKIQPIKMRVNKNGMISIKPSNGLISKFLAGKKGSSYLCKNNEWIFSADNYEELIKILKKEKYSYEKIPKGIIEIVKKQIKNHPFELTGGIFDRLLNFQKLAVEFALNRGGRVLLADDMGLGKTVQALAVANYYCVEFPMLIVAPASLLHAWREAVETFLNEEATIIREQIDFGARISVISYNLASTFSEVIRDRKYNVIICDECHYLKSKKTKRTQQLLPVLQKSSRLIMISGTPALSRPLELYATLCALKCNLFSSFMEYGVRYCNGRKVRNYYDFKGSSNSEELLFIMEKEFMIKRSKEQVLGDLPLKTRKQIILECKKDQCTETRGGLFGNKVDQDIMQLYTEAVEKKKGAVLKYIEEMVKKGKKFLVYAHHQSMLDGIEEHLKATGIQYIRMDGKVASAKRHVLVEEFQTKEEIKIAVLSLTACSTGLTLTAGKAVVFAELYWNPGTLMQAEDRVHRIGQSENVEIHYLVGKNTIDEVVWPLLSKKLSVLEKLGLSKNDYKKMVGVEQNQRTINEFFDKAENYKQ